MDDSMNILHLTLKKRWFDMIASGEKPEEYREKVNFCHDRMKNDKIRYIWRQQYCGKVKVDAVDPVTGKPVAGIVEGE